MFWLFKYSQRDVSLKIFLISRDSLNEIENFVPLQLLTKMIKDWKFLNLEVCFDCLNIVNVMFLLRFSLFHVIRWME